MCEEGADSHREVKGREGEGGRVKCVKRVQTVTGR